MGLENFQAVLEGAIDKLKNVTMDDFEEMAKSPEASSEVVIMLLAFVTIVVGSSWSVTKNMRLKAKGLPPSAEEEEMQHVTTKDAALFPIIGSVMLLSLYIAYQLFAEELFNQLVTLFLVAGSVFAVSAMLYRVTGSNILSGALAVALGATYFATRHFAANNAIAVAICVTSMWQVKLPSFVTGWILLWGLFVYDIWWVFGTEVMVKVARSIEGPVLLKIPKDLMAAEWSPKDMLMLGLGDIVLPGFFVALCLRFDYHKAITRLEAGTRQASSTVRTPLFCAAMVCYTLGLANTIVVMLLFKAAQPALLYLVPWLTFGTAFAALLLGDLPAMYNYKEEPPKEEEPTEDLPWMDELYNVFIAELFNLEKRKAAPKEAKPKAE